MIIKIRVILNVPPRPSSFILKVPMLHIYTQNKLTNDDDFPIYGGSHKWGQYHQNHYGLNYWPWQLGSTQVLTALSRNQHHRT